VLDGWDGIERFFTGGTGITYYYLYRGNGSETGVFIMGDMLEALIGDCV